MTWSTKYLPQEVEKKIYKKWMEGGYFSAGSDHQQKKFFSAILPPPNVTGSLHLGHALNHTIQDCLIRWKKMESGLAVWFPGTDHAGIATQIQVEKEILKNKQTKHSLGREKFLEKIWEWKDKYGSSIIHQMKSLGDACDWDQNLFTLDPVSVQAVRKAFVHFYNKGWVYQGTRLVNWSTGLSSAISDLEVEHREVQSHLWKIKYPIKNKKDFLVIATTRPETLIADQAVAVHPEDPRYQKYHGEHVILPLVHRKLPVITSSHVDPEFGTGVLKITPAHDFNDYKIGKLHNLKELNILDKKGCLNEEGGVYQGLTIQQARKKIVSDLKEQNLLESVEPYTHQVAFCSRSSSVVEPFLSKQWFMKMEGLAGEALKAVEQNLVEFIPKTWTKTFNHWMNNIDDWCLSRQLWWGHQIPAWFCSDCQEVTVCEETPKACQHCHSKNIKQELDVLDTWFSSALWPMSVLRWPQKNLKENPFYPSSVLVTAPDILFFWVARMIMMGLEFQNEVPFKKVYLHGVVRDDQGRKMSKSLGNGEDPIDLIEEYGADALRLSLLSSHARGKDVRFSRKNLEVCRNFLNKIWNAGRFINQMIPSNHPLKKPSTFEDLDRWILNKLKKTEGQINKELKEFRFSSACMQAYHFAWLEFCDWYLEWVKPIIYGEDEGKKQNVYWVASYVFHRLIRLLHPFIPFVTEHIYQQQKIQDHKSILLESYPSKEESWIQSDWKTQEDKMDFIKEVISTLRHIRGENNIPPSTRAEAQIFIPKNLDQKNHFQEIIQSHKASILFLAKLKNFKVVNLKSDQGWRASMPLETHSNIQVSVSLENVVDKQSEIQRLNKKIRKLDQELEIIQRQLSQSSFLKKAPQKIVQEKKNKEIEIQKFIKNLKESREKLK